MRKLVMFIQDSETGEVLKPIDPKYQMGDDVYYIKVKRRKVIVVRTQIASVCYTNMLSYTMMNGFGHHTEDYLYSNKEEAYEEAEKRLRRKKIIYRG